MAAGSGDVTIPLAKPWLGEAEERAVLEVLRGGRLSLGPRLPEFESLFAARVGAGHASAVSSGTAGLHLALRAAGVGPGDEVITSPFSFVASANAIVYTGARPVFADVDPVTLNLDPEAAAAAIGPQTRAMLPVHVFGYPADMSAFEALAETHGLALVEDACEALGAVHGDTGAPVGGRGHPAVFGFYPNKQITTGEGGMVTVGEGALKERIDSERNQGRAPDMGWLDHDRLGYNYRLSEIACALGIAQLGRVEELLAARSRVAGWYREALAGLAGVPGAGGPGRDGLGATGAGGPGPDGWETPDDALALPCEDRNGDARSWFVFVVGLPTGADRDAVIAHLAKSGIQSKPYLPAIHLQPYYRERFGHGPGDMPICEQVSKRSLALPFFAQMTRAQVERVATELGRALKDP